MAVFRIEHCTDYTVISNTLLRDTELSEKALGLFVRILSLPPHWDFSVEGLVSICKGNYESIRTALLELEEKGYLVRNKIRDEQGHYQYTEYVFYEGGAPQSTGGA